MPLIGRHSLNFDFFLAVHWTIIPEPVNSLKDPILFKPLVLEKVVPTSPPHRLLELAVLPLQNMHDLVPLFCHFSINAPIQDLLSAHIKMKRLHSMLKSPLQSLTGCCSISYGKNENNTKGGEGRRGPQP